MTRRSGSAENGTALRSLTTTISSVENPTGTVRRDRCFYEQATERLDLLHQFEHIVAQDLVNTATPLVGVGWPLEMVLEYGAADYTARIESAVRTARAVLADRGVVDK